jgi:hypothetical protein
VFGGGLKKLQQPKADHRRNGTVRFSEDAADERFVFTFEENADHNPAVKQSPNHPSARVCAGGVAVRWPRAQAREMEVDQDMTRRGRCLISALWSANEMHSLIDVPQGATSHSSCFSDVVALILIDDICSHFRKSEQRGKSAMDIDVTRNISSNGDDSPDRKASTR